MCLNTDTLRRVALNVNYGCTRRLIWSPQQLSREWWCKAGLPGRSQGTSGPFRCLMEPEKTPRGYMKTPRGPSRLLVKERTKGAFFFDSQKVYTLFQYVFAAYLNYLIFMNTLWYKRCQSTEKIKRALLWAPNLSSCKQMRLKVTVNGNFALQTTWISMDKNVESFCKMSLKTSDWKSDIIYLR